MKVVTQGVLLCIFHNVYLAYCIYLVYGSNHLAERMFLRGVC